MKMDIAFGQYCEGNSLLHKLDPRAKLIISILYIVVIFTAKNIFAFCAVTAATLLLVLLSQIPATVILRGLKPILFIAAFTAVINVFFFRGTGEALVDFWVIKIYTEGLINAGLIVLRIVLLLISTSMFLTYTTTPIALTDGMEQLLAPLAKLKVPVHDFSMMMTIALRFIPTLIEETEKIMNAQKARGADFSSGSLARRAKAIVPIIIPLFVSAFRRAGDLATAMECRCYTGGAGRTRMNVLKLGLRDFVFTFVIILLGAGVILVNVYAPGYSISM